MCNPRLITINMSNIYIYIYIDKEIETRLQSINMSVV